MEEWYSDGIRHERRQLDSKPRRLSENRNFEILKNESEIIQTSILFGDICCSENKPELAIEMYNTGIDYLEKMLSKHL